MDFPKNNICVAGDDEQLNGGGRICDWGLLVYDLNHQYEEEMREEKSCRLLDEQMKMLMGVGEIFVNVDLG